MSVLCYIRKRQIYFKPPPAPFPVFLDVYILIEYARLLNKLLNHSALQTFSKTIRGLGLPLHKGLFNIRSLIIYKYFKHISLCVWCHVSCTVFQLIRITIYKDGMKTFNFKHVVYQSFNRPFIHSFTPLLSRRDLSSLLNAYKVQMESYEIGSDQRNFDQSKIWLDLNLGPYSLSLRAVKELNHLVVTDPFDIMPEENLFSGLIGPRCYISTFQPYFEMFTLCLYIKNNSMCIFVFHASSLEGVSEVRF